jgi:N-acetyl-anhydromuramyl-L-alanine amidase AmpD
MTFPFRQTPNYTKGDGTPKIGFVIHGTAGNYDGAVDWLCTPPEKRNPISYSSAHAVFAKDGRVTQLVDNNDVSWHAGIMSNPTPEAKAVLPKNLLRTIKNPNLSFIGLELEWLGVGDTITEAQYANVVKYIFDSGIKDPIILCHSQITDYKSDFKTAAGQIDLSITNEIKRRIAPIVPPTPAPVPPGAVMSKDEIKNQIKSLVDKL